MTSGNKVGFREIINYICSAQWRSATSCQMLEVCHAYYYFSIQFRENLEIACCLYPDDDRLSCLYEEECDTDNLSPWPGIARMAEKIDHDEFIRRALLLEPPWKFRAYIDEVGTSYLAKIRRHAPATRAKSIASYEDDGLRRVFLSMLQAPRWDGPVLGAFRFFLLKHVEFDSREGGHGSLSRHLAADDSVTPLWRAFKELLAVAAPELLRPETVPKAGDFVACGGSVHGASLQPQTDVDTVGHEFRIYSSA